MTTPAVPNIDRALGNFKVSAARRSIVVNAVQRTSRGTVGIAELFYSAIDYGRQVRSTAAGYLYELLERQPGFRTFESALPKPTYATSAVPELTNEVLIVLDKSRDLRKQTGGKDGFVGFRHVLFVVATEKQTSPQLNAILRPLDVDAHWLPTNLASFIQQSLELGVNWETWLKIFDVAGIHITQEPVRVGGDESPVGPRSSLMGGAPETVRANARAKSSTSASSISEPESRAAFDRRYAGAPATAGNQQSAQDSADQISQETILHRYRSLCVEDPLLALCRPVRSSAANRAVSFCKGHGSGSPILDQG